MEEYDCSEAVVAWKLDANKANILQSFRDLVVKHELRDRLRNSPDDWVRFLIARDWNLETGFEMFKNSVAWRDKVGANDILDWEPPSIVEKYFTGALLNALDRDGDPIYLERVGRQDLNGMFNTVGRSTYKRYCIYHREETGKKLRDLCKKQNRKLVGRQMTIVFDLEGLSLSQCRPDNLKSFANIMRFDQDNYPEASKVVLILNSPKIFRMVWDGIKNYFDEGTRAKFVFTNPKNQVELLEKYISLENIPVAFGGKNEEQLKQGGKIESKQVESMENTFKQVVVPRNESFMLDPLEINSGDTVFWDLMSKNNSSIGVEFRFVSSPKDTDETMEEIWSEKGQSHSGQFKAESPGHINVKLDYSQTSKFRSPKEAPVRFQFQRSKSSEHSPVNRKCAVSPDPLQLDSPTLLKDNLNSPKIHRSFEDIPTRINLKSPGKTCTQENIIVSAKLKQAVDQLEVQMEALLSDIKREHELVAKSQYLQLSFFDSGYAVIGAFVVVLFGAILM